MQVTLRSNRRRVKRPVTLQMYWYDPDAKQMLTFNATRLEFDYNPKTKKSKPRAVIDELPVYEDSWNDILNLVSKNKTTIQVKEKIPKSVVVFDIDDYSWRRLEKEVKGLSIAYEVDDD